MKVISMFRAVLLSLLIGGAAQTASAWFAFGHVYCDANDNFQIDAGDTAVAGVLVVVTNSSGSFSNASWTTAQGTYLVQLPEGVSD